VSKKIKLWNMQRLTSNIHYYPMLLLLLLPTHLLFLACIHYFLCLFLVLHLFLILFLVWLLNEIIKMLLFIIKVIHLFIFFLHDEFVEVVICHVFPSEPYLRTWDILFLFLWVFWFWPWITIGRIVHLFKLAV